MRIKDFVNSNDIVTAKTLLDTVTAEHDTSTDTDESAHLHHAQDHLNAFQETNDTQQKNATINALDES
jgi:hypothetical protein